MTNPAPTLINTFDDGTFYSVKSYATRAQAVKALRTSGLAIAAAELYREEDKRWSFSGKLAG